MKFSLYTDHGHLFAEIKHRWIDVDFLEAKVMAEPAHDSMFIYVFGWSENGLQLNSYKISSDFSKLFAIGWNDSGSHSLDCELIEDTKRPVSDKDLISQLPVLEHLASLDARYKIKDKWLNPQYRVRVWNINQQPEDPTLVISHPWAVDVEFPFVLSFRLADGTILPNNKPMTSRNWFKNSFTIEKLRQRYPKGPLLTPEIGIELKKQFKTEIKSSRKIDNSPLRGPRSEARTGQLSPRTLKSDIKTLNEFKVFNG